MSVKGPDETTIISTRTDGMASSNSRCARSFRMPEAAIAIGIALLSLIAQPLAAQDSSADVIRGRVTDDSSHAIVATIMVTTISST
jgi:hypothetical protein